MSPTLQKLRALPNPHYSPVWPTGTRQKLSKPLAERFFTLVSTSDTSLLQLLRDHPELPPFKQLDYWRRHTPWFAEGLKQARKNQADFLAEKCLDLAKASTPKNAHVTRVKFDIYRWMAAKFHPEAYGDKPAATPNTTVNVGVALSAERLQELRAKLDDTRRLYLSNPNATVHATPEPAVVSRAQEH